MSVRQEVLSKVSIDGKPYTVKLIQNPTIDDVLISEAQIYAGSLSSGISSEDHRVDRSVRDYLIRLSVER
jgi:hypothetical protein